MNICVFSSSRDNVPEACTEAAAVLGTLLAERGHTLVFGGGATGLMGGMARAADAHGGRIIGVAPRFFDTDGVLYKHCSEFIFTETMAERKSIMEELADAFIAAPGGIGTLEELLEVFTLKQLGRHSKPVILLSPNGYYDRFCELLRTMAEEGFMSPSDLTLLRSASSPEIVLDLIENSI